MIGGVGAGAGRATNGRSRRNTSGTSQSSSEPPSTASRGHRHSMSDARLENDEATASTSRRSAFLEPLPLSRLSSTANGSNVSSPTTPSSADGMLLIENGISCLSLLMMIVMIVHICKSQNFVRF